MSAKKSSKSGLSYREFLSSPTFALQADGSDTQYKIHDALLASKSPALSAACNNGMRETGEGRMKLQGVSEDVLVNFAEWAYTGEYDVDGDNRWKENSEIESLNPLKDGLWPPEPPWGGSQFGFTLQKEELAEEDTDIPEMGDSEELSVDNGPTHPLLLHVQVYVFAEMYIISELKALTYQRIHQGLQFLDLTYSRRNKEMALDVLKYAFENLPENDALVSWLSKYAAFKLCDLRRLKRRFDGLLKTSDGKFAAKVLENFEGSSKSPWPDTRFEDKRFEHKSGKGKRGPKKNVDPFSAW
ncbi:MAG: hypothetical protein M4579_007433 [Chaenotheca gracillima]|nr:MAG: hypothetical protein M4579_007433 [Chaenotheca gracillima]